MSETAYTFPSPSGDPLFKWNGNGWVQSLEKVSVPFRGSFIQITFFLAIVWNAMGFRPLPGILYSNWTYASTTFTTSCRFRPLPGILYSNDFYFTNAVTQAFPSPSGDPLFKYLLSVPHEIKLGFRPLPEILYSNICSESLPSSSEVSVPFRRSFIQITPWWVFEN